MHAVRTVGGSGRSFSVTVVLVADASPDVEQVAWLDSKLGQENALRSRRSMRLATSNLRPMGGMVA